MELSEKHTYVSPKHFTVLALRFSSVIYFELFFVSGRVRVQLCSFACGDPVVPAPFKEIILFIFGCAGSSLLCVGFL